MSAKMSCAVLAFAAGVSFAGTAAAATTSSWCATGKPVKFAGLNWESADFVTETLRYILEKGYGCQTDALPGNSVTMELALSRNDIQVFAEEWVGRSDAWNDAAKAGKVVGVGNTVVGAIEGWYVPDYVIKGDAARGIKPMAPELKSVQDLPKYKQLFADDEEPSKGRFLNCPAGWTCSGVNSQKLIAYNLTDTYVNFRPGTGAALDGTISSAVQRGKPILFYYWTPTPLIGRYKFIRLQEPAYTEACWKTLADEKNTKPCGSASTEAKIQIGLSRTFNDADPVLVDLFTKVNFPIDLLNKLLAEQFEKKLEAKAMSRAFLSQQSAVWSAWMPPDVASKVTASLK